MSYKKAPRTAAGLRMRALREARDMTQLDVEVKARLGIGYLQRLELGKVQQPEQETLERILSTLDVTFIERREVFALFGYAIAFTQPDERESQWAREIFQAEVNQAKLPVYLLDCAHRLLAWNGLVSKLYRDIKVEAHTDLMPPLVFDAIDGVASAIMNADAFFSAQVRIVQYERQRCGDDTWYSAFIDRMRQYKAFDEHWIKYSTSAQPYVPIRPMVQLKLDMGSGITHFRLISEPFIHDERFRVIYYIPADADTLRQCEEWQITQSPRFLERHRMSHFNC